MGSLHNELRSGRIITAYKAALGMKDGQEGVERLSESLVGVIDLWRHPEFAQLRGERLCGGMRTAGAVVAEFSGVALGNPAGSGMIAVVEACAARVATLGQITQLEIGIDATFLATLTTSGSGFVRDRRGLTSTASRLLIRTGTDAAATLGQLLETNSPTVAEVQIPWLMPPVILAPGDGLLMIHQTTNTALTGIFRWRERLAFPSELE